MIIYFYLYCMLGILSLAIAHYLQTPEQAKKKNNDMRDAEDHAARVLPLPALAAVYILTGATTILFWPIFVIRSLLNGDAP